MIDIFVDCFEVVDCCWRCRLLKDCCVPFARLSKH